MREGPALVALFFVGIAPPAQAETETRTVHFIDGDKTCAFETRSGGGYRVRCPDLPDIAMTGEIEPKLRLQTATLTALDAVFPGMSAARFVATLSGHGDLRLHLTERHGFHLRGTVRGELQMPELVRDLVGLLGPPPPVSQPFLLLAERRLGVRWFELVFPLAEGCASPQTVNPAIGTRLRPSQLQLTLSAKNEGLDVSDALLKMEAKLSAAFFFQPTKWDDWLAYELSLRVPKPQPGKPPAPKLEGKMKGACGGGACGCDPDAYAGAWHPFGFQPFSVASFSILTAFTPTGLVFAGFSVDEAKLLSAATTVDHVKLLLGVNNPANTYLEVRQDRVPMSLALGVIPPLAVLAGQLDASFPAVQNFELSVAPFASLAENARKGLRVAGDVQEGALAAHLDGQADLALSNLLHPYADSHLRLGIRIGDDFAKGVRRLAKKSVVLQPAIKAILDSFALHALAIDFGASKRDEAEDELNAELGVELRVDMSMFGSRHHQKLGLSHVGFSTETLQSQVVSAMEGSVGGLLGHLINDLAKVAEDAAAEASRAVSSASRHTKAWLKSNTARLARRVHDSFQNLGKKIGGLFKKKRKKKKRQRVDVQAEFAALAQKLKQSADDNASELAAHSYVSLARYVQFAQSRFTTPALARAAKASFDQRWDEMAEDLKKLWLDAYGRDETVLRAAIADTLGPDYSQVKTATERLLWARRQLVHRSFARFILMVKGRSLAATAAGVPLIDAGRIAALESILPPVRADERAPLVPLPGASAEPAMLACSEPGYDGDCVWLSAGRSNAISEHLKDGIASVHFPDRCYAKVYRGENGRGTSGRLVPAAYGLSDLTRAAFKSWAHHIGSADIVCNDDWYKHADEVKQYQSLFFTELKFTYYSVRTGKVDDGGNHRAELHVSAQIDGDAVMANRRHPEWQVGGWSELRIGKSWIRHVPDVPGHCIHFYQGILDRDKHNKYHAQRSWRTTSCYDGRRQTWTGLTDTPVGRGKYDIDSGKEPIVAEPTYTLTARPI